MSQNNPEAIMIPYHPLRQWIWVVTFAIAFAWVESSIVVYLREIFFDGNFSFPLIIEWQGEKHVISPLIRIEFVREIATIIMLISIGWAAGKDRFHRFCFFLIAFGIWDIFYYVFLRVMIGWPESLMTWDLLFYVPLPWVGPVITPVLIAVTMVISGSVLIYLSEKGFPIIMRWYDILIEFSLGLVMIVAFCWDYKNILQIPGEGIRTGIPNPFAWWLYLPSLFASIVYLGYRLHQMTQSKQ